MRILIVDDDSTWLQKNMSELTTHLSASAGSEALAELLRFSLAVNRSSNADEILREALDTTRVLSGCDEASVLLVDIGRNQLQREVSTAELKLDRRVGRAGGATRWLLDNDKPLVVGDTARSRFESSPMSPENRIGAYVGTSIRRANEVIGVHYAIWRSPREIDQQAVALLGALADLTGMALHGAQLVDSLQELNDYLSGMLQVAAHDLRSPLGTAIGTLHMFTDELLPDPSPEQQRALRILASSMGRMRDLVEGILNYERWSADGDADWKPSDLNLIVSGVLEDYRDAAEAHGQQLVFEPDAGPLVIVADEPLLREAIGNLVSNANKYTPDGGHITVKTVSSRPQFQVIVADDGPGISAADQAKLFHPFVRLRSGRQKPGSGLGLNLVKKITERHGGSVGVDSEIGVGSKFIMRLPEMTL